ncbi:DUF2283 domain-containing protein [Actinomadura rubrisoli]|uniref:DUF2283 domain-containing protein n=1 Tax=Actinomadura rubrisoli TaxID=2530368 RepID=A0A4R5BHE7_9ACTN|nr:DUF2283 domain-containing protein [Actinomadura rubrisoli]TDD84803.1 DUF2283 domain-containing protein [Actinomadura rubrisoli]
MNNDARNAQIIVSDEVDALYIKVADQIGEGEVAHSESFALSARASEVVFDLSADGRLLGIEIIGIEGLLKNMERS